MCIFNFADLQNVLVSQLVKINENLLELLRRTAIHSEAAAGDLELGHPNLPLSSTDEFDQFLDWLRLDPENLVLFVSTHLITQFHFS